MASGDDVDAKEAHTEAPPAPPPPVETGMSPAEVAEPEAVKLSPDAQSPDAKNANEMENYTGDDLMKYEDFINQTREPSDTNKTLDESRTWWNGCVPFRMCPDPRAEAAAEEARRKAQEQEIQEALDKRWKETPALRLKMTRLETSRTEVSKPPPKVHRDGEAAF